MNLHGIAGPIIAAVNPMVLATVKYSDGSQIDPETYEQVPKYVVVPDVTVQMQALTAKELAQTDGLNIQGLMRAMYFFGDTQGVERPLGKGGDLVTIGTQVWLVVTVLETWPDWSKVAVTLQMDAP